MTLWEAGLLGVVQGLTEFLPISSTAHLLLTRQLLGHGQADDGFTTIIQLGTLVAVFLYFRKDLAQYVTGVWTDLRTRKFGSSRASVMAYLVVLGSLPVIVAGVLFNKIIKGKLYDAMSIGLVAIIFALLMWAAEVWHRTRREDRKLPEVPEEKLSWKEALWMGLWQMLALMPGASRSGSTISGGLFAGLDRSAAARFSFLLSLPAILGAGVKDLYEQYALLKKPDPAKGVSIFANPDDTLALVVGTVVSGVVGYFSIAWLMNFLKKQTMMAFVWYRLVLGALILLLVWRGVLR
jgi:undecaprenyl-diphosphatase